MGRRLLALVLLVPLTLACAFLPIGGGTPAEGSTSIAGAVTFVATIRPTATDVPTLEPWPTPSPMRTDEPTPRPPPTQIPTRTPAPIVLTGKGDDVVSLKKEQGVALLRISNDGAGNFIVRNYDSDANRIDLLVNAIGPYQGVVMIDVFDNKPQTTRLEVNSSGSWKIELLRLADAARVTVPGSVAGKGDAVVLVLGAQPDLLKISHAGKGNFTVWAFYTGFRTLVVNEIGVYSGTKPLSSSTFLFQIHADGAWNMSITAR